MDTTEKTYNNRARKQLMERIADLSQMEHDEIFKIVRECMPGCNFTKNTNGVFFNMSTFSDDVIQRLEAFVNFCVENKKELDEYDMRLKECKRNVLGIVSDSNVRDANTNLDPVACPEHLASDAGLVLDPAPSTTLFDVAWTRVVEGSESALAMAKVLYNTDRTAKKKVYTKFHAAKKRYSKRVATDKRNDNELMNDLCKVI